jgi:hypothetical protein
MFIHGALCRMCSTEFRACVRLGCAALQKLYSSGSFGAPKLPESLLRRPPKFIDLLQIGDF